jgi:hypothetical protein
MSITADRMRELVGNRVRLQVAEGGGATSLEGRVTSCLESDDGLVVFLTEDGGSTRTIHYHHIEAVEPVA